MPEKALSTVQVIIAPARVRQWHVRLGQALMNADHCLDWAFSEEPAPTSPVSLELLLSMEHLLSGHPTGQSAERVTCNMLPRDPTAGSPDIILDLTSSGGLLSGRTILRPLYDGVADELAVFSALLAGRTPVVEIERQPEGGIVARGTPSLEGTTTLHEGHGIVVSLTSALLVGAIGDVAGIGGVVVHRSSQFRPMQVPAYLVRKLATLALRRLYSTCCFSPHWRTGWRFVTDRDVWDQMSLRGPGWNVIENPAFRFLADPFPVTWQGATYVFVEDFDHRTGKGIISFVPFGKDGPIGAPQPALEEPWHLSYPFMVEHGGSVWMIPESSACRQVVLYRADPFPTRWVKEAILLDNIFATDATIMQHSGRFWMLVTCSSGTSYSDALSIYHSCDLLGPWIPHAGNPVLIDAGSARSAGNIIVRNGELWRPVQDCRGGYGTALGLARIDEITMESYRQTVRTILRPSVEWPGRRLHTLNRAGKLECIDGSANAMRFGADRAWSFR
jgi:hypothetical protein